ncbi:ROK family protein [Lederbergia citrea]|uniref:ROK family protein n=1 Tax=Lederbergia citrea TaxID=2833581 RepID=UPI001BC9E3DF|nr:ROK family protein [Lederbergia citrea]MBS4177891.1 ROK family protein [Lederbergia citrea]
MITGDAAYIKKLNRGLILSKIIENDGISRADLSKITGLNKATISVQVADLLEEELLVEGQQEHKNLGRRPIILSLNRKAGYALGIDLDKGQVIFNLTDLLGYPVHTETVQLETTNYEEILDLLSTYISDFKSRCQESAYGIIGVVVGVHGIVSSEENIHFVPQLQWRNQNLKADLEKKIAVKVFVENNANLTAFAERVYKHNQSDHLLSITMQSGIGLGMMTNGEILKGFHGYAGEIGHMIVVPDGEPCPCGNQGCWERYAAESSFFRELAEKYGRHNADFHDIQAWLDAKDPVMHELIDCFIKYISIGLNNVINLYNPEVIVLNSELLRLYPDAVKKIKARLTSTISHYDELLVSDFGKQACVMGACVYGIKNFLEISDLNLQVTDEKLAAAGEYF